MFKTKPRKLGLTPTAQFTFRQPVPRSPPDGYLHGVSAKHLPRYAREWNYRFNRRRRIADLTDFLLRRAAIQPSPTASSSTALKSTEPYLL
jgi:hypothetical protein